jgi:hypothetical protein
MEMGDQFTEFSDSTSKCVVDRPGLVENVSPTTPICTGEDARAYIPLRRDRDDEVVAGLAHEGIRYSPSITETSGNTISSSGTEAVIPDPGRTNKIAICAERRQH